MIRSILVPLDGSEFGEHALPMAASLAKKANATLHLAHVHQLVMPVTVEGVAILDTADLHVRLDEQAYIADVARRIAGRAPLKVEQALLDGDVVSALKDFSARKSIDLVVMSTHARGAIGRFWLGSVADTLVSQLALPILLVRAHEGKPDFARELDMHRIVVPLDGTAVAEQMLASASEVARLFDAELHLVRVNPPPILTDYLPEGVGSVRIPMPDSELAMREREESTRYLAGMAEELAAKGLRVRTHVVVGERPSDGILAEAEADHADLIAVETHGRRGLSRFFFGSVADEVVRGSEVPVLLQKVAVG